jgi:SAM-dependent methyltransferase
VTRRSSCGKVQLMVEKAPSPPDFQDLIGEDTPDLDSYFDRREFETRAWMEDQHYWHRHRKSVILQTLRAHCPAQDRPLIELGCGAGTVATFLNQEGYRVDYCDIHAEGLRLARQRLPKAVAERQPPPRFFRTDITRRLPEGDYQGYLLLDVLEHLPDDHGVMRAVQERLLATAGRLAQPAVDGGIQGFVLLTVPAFPALWSPWDDIEKHKRRYTLASARALCEETGFRVVYSTCFFMPLFFAAAAVKGIRRLRQAVAGNPPAARAMTELAEAKSGRWLSSLVLAILTPERVWLRRWRGIPLGTSILVVASPT